MPNYSDEETRTLTKEMSDKIYNDSYSTTEEELKTDTNWIEATKSVYKELEGVEWSGADEDAAKTGLDLMSRFNYNLTLGTINYTAKLQDADPKTKLAFYYMMDMYDKKDISGNGVMRAFKEMGLDPASYIGIGTLGMGFAGKQAATVAAKTGLKAMLKQGAISYLKSPTAVAATEGAIYTGADDFARQDAAIGAGVQDEYSPGQTAVATTIGAGAGAGIVKGTQAVGRKLSQYAKEGEEEMLKTAGGGTPPKIVIDSFGLSFKDEVDKLNKRQLKTNIQRIAGEQLKREKLLSSPQELENYALDKGMPVDEMKDIIETNYTNNTNRLKYYEESLKTKEDVKVNPIKFNDIKRGD